MWIKIYVFSLHHWVGEMCLMNVDGAADHFSFIVELSKLYRLIFICNCGQQWMNGWASNIQPREWVCLCLYLYYFNRLDDWRISPIILLLGAPGAHNGTSWQMLSPWASNGISKPSFLSLIIMVLRGICVLCTLSACAMFSSRYANTALNLEMPICINILVSYSS